MPHVDGSTRKRECDQSFARPTLGEQWNEVIDTRTLGEISRGLLEHRVDRLRREAVELLLQPGLHVYERTRVAVLVSTRRAAAPV